MMQAGIRLAQMSSCTKFWENPAAMPNRPPETVVAIIAFRRPILLDSQTHAGPAGTDTSLPNAAIMPKWPLFRLIALAMDGNRVVIRPASVLSTTVTPVRTPRVRHRGGTCEALTSRALSIAFSVLFIVGSCLRVGWGDRSGARGRARCNAGGTCCQ